MTVAQFLIGTAAMAVGMHMVIKTDVYFGIMGQNAWAEAKLGPGGTRLLYKLIGMFITFLGILGVTGQLTGFAQGAVMSVFGSRGAK